MNLEIVRIIILVVGWPILVAGSFLILWIAIKFSRAIKAGMAGKLVLSMTVVQVVGMYALGIVSTALLFMNLKIGILVVLPVFVVWFIIFVTSIIASIRWGREVVNINKMYEGLEVAVEERTNELKESNERLAEDQKKMKAHTEELEKFNRLMVDRELRMIELKKEIAELKTKLVQVGDTK